jgi:hypothetical protein
MDECRGRQDAGSGLLQRKRVADHVAGKLATTFWIICSYMHTIVHGKSGVLPCQEFVGELLCYRLVFNQVIQYGMA